MRRVLSRLRGGSSSPVVVDTAAGRWVAKLRGAAQGPAALVAEVIVAELAEALGLPVPERALLELGEDVESEDRNDELSDLLSASAGQNLGFRWLEGAELLDASAAKDVEDQFAVPVLWLDALVMNLDRGTANTNILISKGQPWLIDHGAALFFQYDWARVSEGSPRAPTRHELHVFGARQHLLSAWDERLAKVLTREVLERATERVPDSFLASRPKEWTLARARAAYAAFLWKRLTPPRPFVPAPAVT